MDIDHLLFNPNVSPLFPGLNVYQMIPALAVQGRGPTDTSDVATQRRKARGLESIWQKVVRTAIELRELPRQVVGLASGRTRIVRVGYR